MSKKMLIDGTHSEELRVALLENNRIQNFEVETTGKAQIKGNIYVAEVSRVEPSLQAAFITYGGNRNGFLAFGELHPAFFDVPKTEKDALIQELEDIAAKRRSHKEEPHEADENMEARAENADDDKSDDNTHSDAASLSKEEMDEDARALAIANQIDPLAQEQQSPKIRRSSRQKQEPQAELPVKEERKLPIHRRYKIEDVLKEGQKILIQVVKEERGNKGAALTTYFTLPGRYTVLMPNTPYAGGISRKVTDNKERKALKEIFEDLKVPLDMGLIIRTAGVGQEAKNIKKDFKNLTSLWTSIQKEFRKKESTIRCLHEDGSVIIRALRDMAKDDVTEVIISGKRQYQQAKDYAKSLMPEMSKLIVEHKNDTPIFIKHGIEKQLTELHRTRVELPSGGYLIIHPTEALVSVDVNSGRATQEKNIEETALKTNLEAAEELARQVRLRDLAGLIVIDFIDMEETRNNRALERAMRREIRKDRARIQVGNISDFGLMEISRQRLRPSFAESHYIMCPHCNGTGQIHALASSALLVLRHLEEEEAQEADRLIVTTSADLVVHILNHKRELIRDMEAKYKYQILFRTDDKHEAPDFRLDIVRVKADGSENSQTQEIVLREQPEQPPEVRYRRQNRRGRKKDTSTEARLKTAKASSHEEKKNAEDKPRRTRRRNPRKETADTTDQTTQTPQKTEEQSAAQEKPARAPRRRTAKKETENAEGAAENQSNTEKKAAPKRTRKPTQSEDKKTEATTPATEKKAAAPRRKAASSKKNVEEVKSTQEGEINSVPQTPKKEKAPAPKKPVVKDQPLQVEKIGSDGKPVADKTENKEPARPFQRWWSKA